ncbi:peptidylprolyl isomerase, partial [Erysipelothrix rhusiopathiae]|nr:peptidylprolyl isomerase [Erysipelothrix rhusiopathiae]
MNNGKTMTAELYEDIAPKTVANFVKLIEDK